MHFGHRDCSRKAVFLLLAVLVLASGCRSTPVVHPQSPANAGEARPLLNSERIRQRFGSYGVEVLDESDDVRVSNLFSVADEVKVSRTIAVVLYSTHLPDDVLPAHLEIKRGGSIGEVFTRRGWKVSKQNLYFGDLKPSADLSGVYARMGGIAPTALAVHIYEFVASKDDEELRYATITEIHHPDYLSQSMLEEIYGPVAAKERSADNGVNSILKTVREAVLSAIPPLRKAALRLAPASSGAGYYKPTPLPSV